MARSLPTRPPLSSLGPGRGDEGNLLRQEVQTFGFHTPKNLLCVFFFFSLGSQPLQAISGIGALAQDFTSVVKTICPLL